MIINYLQDGLADPAFSLIRRLQKNVAGFGGLGDLGVHISGLARFLVDEFESVICFTETFIKQRPQLSSKGNGGKNTWKVTVDDAALAIVRLKNGALGSFEMSRLCNGRKAINGLR